MIMKSLTIDRTGGRRTWGVEAFIQAEKEEEQWQGLLLETPCNILASLTERLLVLCRFICWLKGSPDQAGGPFQERSNYGSGLHDSGQETGLRLQPGVSKDGIVVFNTSLMGSFILFGGRVPILARQAIAYLFCCFHFFIFLETM